MMLLHHHTVIFFLSSFVLSCVGLRCTTRCSYRFNRTTSFSIPDKCDQFVTASKCTILSTYSYDTDEYTIHFFGIPSMSNTILENFHEAKLTVSSMISFTYTIHRECDDKDDCDRNLAKTVANEMQQEQHYNLSDIQNELKPFILGPSLTPENSNLTCYDSNENIQSCGTLTESGSCVISNNIFQNKITYVCGDKGIFSTPFVDIYQSEHYLSFNIQCNQSLCNNQTTLQQVKSIMYKYDITVTPDGRLYNQSSKLIASIIVKMIMILILLFKD